MLGNRVNRVLFVLFSFVFSLYFVPQLSAFYDVGASAAPSAPDAATTTDSAITGTVRENGGSEIPDIHVAITREEDDWDFDTCTDSNGVYVFATLEPGTYRVAASRGWNWCLDAPAQYIAQFYDHKDSYDEADPILLASSQTVEDVDFELSPGGTIAGTVVDAADGTTPLPDIEVHVGAYDPGCDCWQGVNNGTTNASGQYAVGGLPAGEGYRLSYHDPVGFYAPEIHNDMQTNDWSAGDNVAVVNGATTTVNADLAEGAQIDGLVRDLADLSPIDEIDVSAFRDDNGSWQWAYGTRTDANGLYDMTVAKDVYRLEFWDDHHGTYLGEYYDDEPDLDNAHDIDLTGGGTFMANADLVEGGTITGFVYDDAGAPLGDFNVHAGLDDGWGRGACTEADGSYVISGLPLGDYVVESGGGWNGCQEQPSPYIHQYYDHTVDWNQATRVIIDVPGDVEPGIDFDLQTGGSISGQVTADVGGGGLSGIVVNVYEWDPDNCCNHVNGDQTQSDGSFVVGGLPGGDYRVAFHDPNGVFAVETYDDIPGGDLWSGDTVPVTTGLDTPGINAGLAVGGMITGTVTADSDGSLLPEIDVTASGFVGANWYYADGMRTDENGVYSFVLLPGDYRIEFQDHHCDTYLREYYDNQPDFDNADTVIVTEGVTEGNIDASLAEGGQISGIVYDDTGAPLENISVNAGLDDGWGQGACTEADGSYLINGLLLGDYVVEAGGGWNWCLDQPSEHIRQYYDHTDDWNQATLVIIDVPGDVEPGIDFDLQLGGSISGQVTADVGGAGLGGIDVEVYAWDPNDCCNHINGAQTEPDGSYVVGGLSGGDYRVQFRDPNGAFATETFDDVPGSDLWRGDNVPVTAGLDTPGISAGLAAGGMITGTITADSDGSLLPEIDVTVSGFDGADWYYVESLRTDENGAYSFVLLPGNYRVEFEDHHYDTYIRQYFDNKPDVESADTVVVTEGVTEGNVDAAMVEGGHISGIVLDDAGAPLENINVYAGQANGWGRGVCTEADGSYVASGLRSGDYVVEGGVGWNWCLEEQNSYIGQYYDHVDDWNLATPVTIDVPGETEPGINFELLVGGSISGQVTANVGGVLEGIQVDVYVWDPDDCCDNVSSAETQSDGSYSVGGLEGGDYRVQFRDPSALYATETYDNVPGTDLWNGDNVPVTTGHDTPGINAGLAAGGSITGTVTADSDGSLLPEIDVSVSGFDGADWYYVESLRTDENGAYSFVLLPGDYRVEFEDHHYDTYLREYYNDQPDFDSADTVVVTEGATEGNIDASLAEGGQISGIVFDVSGAPIPNLNIHTWRDGDGWGPDTCTDENGYYQLQGLEPGNYWVVAADGWNWCLDQPAEYIRQYYDHATSQNDATPLPLGPGQSEQDINFDLGQGGSIGGHIVDAADGTTPLPDIQVDVNAYDPACSCWYGVGYSFTDANGDYLVGGLPELLTGDGYHVSFWDTQDIYAPEAYNDIQTNDWWQGDAVYVTDGLTTIVDADLAEGAYFRGLVTADLDDSPLEQINVSAYRFEGGGWQWAYGTGTSNDGTYELTVAPAIYKLEFRDEHHRLYLSEYYDNAPDQGSAQLIDLTSGGVYFADAGLEEGITHEIQLAAGWNMISSYIDPLNCVLSNHLMQDIVNQMVLMKDSFGGVYWPDQGIDTIGCWNWGHGYQIYMGSAAVLSITGRVVDTAVMPIDLSPGWSLTAYAKDGPIAVEPALGSLTGLLRLAKNGYGEVYWPAYGVNQIGDMQPGQGYMVYLDGPGDLVYP